MEMAMKRGEDAVVDKSLTLSDHQKYLKELEAEMGSIKRGKGKVAAPGQKRGVKKWLMNS